MRNKIAIGAGVLGIILIISLVVYYFSIKNRTNEQENVGDNPPPSLNLEQANFGVTPVAIDILPYTFNTPSEWFLQRQNGDTANFILSNVESYDISKPGVIVVEVMGWSVKPTATTTINYIKKNFAKPTAKVTEIGTTVGGQKMFRVDNPTGSKTGSVGYAVEHDSTHVSFWLAEKYPELPALEEMVKSITPTTN